MTDNEKPVFFSTHLHDDLEHAFDDLRRIHGEISAVIRNMEDAASKCSDPEREKELRFYADAALGPTDDLEKWTTTNGSALK